MTDEYFLNRQVIISSYDENWPGMFEKEKMLILSVIEKYDVIVEHIGSTSVVNLSAKPILDIMFGTKDLSTENRCIKPLEAIGYEYVPALEKDFPERRFLHKGPNLPNKHVHLHMIVVDSGFWNRQLLFRNYLRNNPDARQDYQDLKIKLAAQYQKDVYGYCEAKTEFIKNILALVGVE